MCSKKIIDICRKELIEKKINHWKVTKFSINNDDHILSLIDMFIDGKECWCLVSGPDSSKEWTNTRLFNTTQFFEYATDKNGIKKEILLYSGGCSNFVFLGKINTEDIGDREVLIKINFSGKWPFAGFSEIKDFGKNTSIWKLDDQKIALIILEDDKKLRFNLASFNTIGNIVDDYWEIRGVPGSCAFLKSYVVSGRIRAFLGICEQETGVVKPFGYDLNKKECVSFCLDSYDLIDEKLMEEHLKEENFVGFDLSEYKEIIKEQYLPSILEKLEIFYNDAMDSLLKANSISPQK